MMKMKNSWRFLLSRNYPRSPLRVSTISQVLTPHPTHSFHNIAFRPFNTMKSVSILDHRSFSSEAAVQQKDPDHALVTTVTDIFTRFTNKDHIKRELESNAFVFTHEMVLKVLMNVESSPDVARRVFDWVLETDKPSTSCTILLKKLVVSELDMRLFTRVVRTFVESGNALTDSMVDTVLKSLISVGRLGECNKVLKVIMEHGFVPDGNLQSKITFRLASAGKTDETAEFIGLVEASNIGLDHKAWASSIEGCCAAGDLESALTYFEKMVEKEGVSRTGHAFQWLIFSYCSRKRAMDACKLLHKYVSETQLRPSHATYMELVKKLLARGGFQDALSLLGLMKNDGFPPIVDPFIDYVSRSGSSDDAIAFLNSMTSKNFPSMAVVLRVFEAFAEAARQNEAQDLLSKCPSYIRNNADVLNLLCSMKSGQVVTAPALVV